MSIGNVEHVMIRIKGSEPYSPIAVFRCKAPDKLEALFAATIATLELIDSQAPHLIGIYDGTMPQDEVYNELKKCVV